MPPASRFAADRPRPVRHLRSAAVVVCAALVIALLLPPAEQAAASALDHAFSDDPPTTTVAGKAVVPGVRGVVPDVDVVVPVGALTQSLLSSHPEGTRFGIAGGVHRLTGVLRPRDRQQLLGFPGAVLSGAKVLTGWTRTGSRWYVRGQTQRLPVNLPPEDEIACDGESPLCNRAEDVFIDGVTQRQVGSLDEVVPGTYFFDEHNDRIYVGSNPAGRLVETTVTPQAIAGGGRDVVIRDLVVEKFGNPAQLAAVHDGWRPGWVVEHNEIRLNHSVGVQLHGGVLRANVIRHNGQLGVGGGGHGLLVEGNEIAHNNTQGYHMYWEAGGTKWVGATQLTVRGNWSHHNRGQGLWTDLDNDRILYEDNTVEDNDMAGIMHELSYTAVIRDNIARRNGRRIGWYQEGAGILVYNSQNVQVYGNLVSDNAAGIAVRNDARPPWVVRYVSVVGNRIGMTQGRTGLVDETGTPGMFSPDNVAFYKNQYVVPSFNQRWFEWDDLLGRTFSQWQALGHDFDSRIVRSFAELDQPPPPPDPGGSAAPVTLSDSFSGPDGSYWSDAVWADFSGLAGSVQDLQGGQGRMTTGRLAPYAWALAEPLGGSRADGEVLITTTRRDGASEAYVEVWQRASDNGGGHPRDGYKVETSWDGSRGRMMLFRVRDGAATWLGTLKAAPQVGQPIRLRFATVGTTIAAKAWPAGSAEPSAWDVQVTDSAVSQGTRRLRVMSGAVPTDVDVRFDDYVDRPL